MESIFHYDHHCDLPDPDDLVVIREGCVSFRLESAHHRLLGGQHGSSIFLQIHNEPSTDFDTWGQLTKGPHTESLLDGKLQTKTGEVQVWLDWLL